MKNVFRNRVMRADATADFTPVNLQEVRGASWRSIINLKG